MARALIRQPAEVAPRSELLHKRHGHDVAHMACKRLAQPCSDHFVGDNNDGWPRKRARADVFG